MDRKSENALRTGTYISGGMYDPNAINCKVNNGVVFDYSKDFSSRHPKTNFGEKVKVKVLEIRDYSDDEILKMPPR